MHFNEIFFEASIQLSTAMKEIVSLKEQMKLAQSKILSEQSNARKCKMLGLLYVSALHKFFLQIKGPL